jgi:RecB family exonuclease
MRLLQQPDGNDRSIRAEEVEQKVLHAVLDAVKDRDELIRKAEADFEEKKRRLFYRNPLDLAWWQNRLLEIEREKLEYFRQSARGSLSDDQLDTL